MSAAVLTTAYLKFGHDRDYVFCVETAFRVEGANERCAATSCCCPTWRRCGPSSTPFACPDSMPAPALSERDLAVLRSFARRIDPSDAGAHNNLGVLYYHKGLVEEAVAAFTRALELDPQDAGRAANLEIAYRNTGYYDRRVAELQRAAPPPAPTIATRAGSWAAPTPPLGRHDEAVAEFEALLA